MVSWNDLKVCMPVRVLPLHYRKKLLFKLQRLHQGSRTVDEYYKDLEVTFIKINMHESEVSKIARFVSELRRGIQNILELYEYTSMEKLIHLAITVESQFFFLKKKTLLKILIMVVFTNPLGRTKKNLNQDSPSNFSRESTSQHQHSKDNLSSF